MSVAGTMDGRNLCRDELDEHLPAWTSRLEDRAAMAELQAVGVAAGAVLSAIELCGDPYPAARGALVPVEHPDAGCHRDLRPPWRFGEHNRTVLTEVLGPDSTAIDALEAHAIVASEPLPQSECRCEETDMNERSTGTLLTPQVEALVGQTSEVVKMYGTVDQETVRRYVIGIPDQDPRHWDAELAAPLFGATTAPAAMVTYIGHRRPPWEPDDFPRLMAEDPLRDSVSMVRSGDDLLASVRAVASTSSHLHAGDEIEVLAYPKLGDRIFYQSRFANIEEKVGRDGKPFLLITRETRFWNQNDQTLVVLRALGIER